MSQFLQNEYVVVSMLMTLAHVLGVLTAVHAIMTNRTSQGAIAWSFPLVMFPYVALPLYWIFGRNRFQGYAVARRAGHEEINRVAEQLTQYVPQVSASLQGDEKRYGVLEQLAQMPFTQFNDAELLIDGEQTFAEIFEAIETAEHYLLFQFFIVRDDNLGREIKSRLLQRASRGLKVYFLYDEIGSYELPKEYREQLEAVGVEIHSFLSTRGPNNRFQINFRNHRKIVVADGKTAYLGGHNVGDEYLGNSEKFGPWRDTHVKLTGPCVQGVQLSFVEDWYWSTRQVLNLNWTPESADGANRKVLILPTGPADDLDTCGLFFTHAIHSATSRVWIASPYFVPDSCVVAALKLAALRGVDVRIMLPDKPDHKLVYLSGFSFVEEIQPAGAKIFRYKPGFLHQKVMIVDDDFAAVGTANLDNRSFRLNFEITAVVLDDDFAEQTRQMLERDFENCEETSLDDVRKRWFGFRVATKVARLMAPLQ